MHKIFIFISN